MTVKSGCSLNIRTYDETIVNSTKHSYFFGQAFSSYKDQEIVCTFILLLLVV